MPTTATIPNSSIPIATLTFNGQRFDMPMNEEWARFFRDLQVRTGGVPGILAATGGGTGFGAYTVGDILFANTAASLTRLNIAATGNALLSGAAPSWGKVGLTTHVSGVLPEANGGTGFTAFSADLSAWLQAANSSNLRVAVTDGTGTGSLVFADTPTLVAPILGTPTSGNLSNCTDYPTSALSGTVPVSQGGTGITSGTSGGIPYYSSNSTIAASAALTANALTLGGGAGGAPVSLGSLGTTTTVLHGNAAGAPTFAPVSLTSDVSGTLPVANGGTGVTALSSLTANPSASVGLSAVNGSASTFMRSDAAPALSESISPTWTGNHTFTPASGNTVFSSGNVGVGGSPSAVFGSRRVLHVQDATNGADVRIAGTSGGDAAVTSAGGSLFIANIAGTAANSHIIFSNGATTFASATERMRISGAGDTIVTLLGTAPTLSTNSQMVFTLTSNTNLRISVRGTDGTTRVANITLA